MIRKNSKDWDYQKDAGQPIVIKSEQDETGIFTGHASVFDNVDQDNEIMAKGAFTETLASRGSTFPLLDSHDPRRPIGFVEVSEDAKGLHVDKGRINLDSSAGRDVFSMLKFARDNHTKIYNGMSVGFGAKPGNMETNADGQVVFKSVDLREVSVVTFPSNERASFSAVKSAAQKLDIEDIPFFEGNNERVEEFFKEHRRAKEQFSQFVIKGESAIDVVDGRLAIIPVAVYRITAKNFGTCDANTRAALSQLYRKMDRSPPWMPTDLDDMRKHVRDLEEQANNTPAGSDEAVELINAWSNTGDSNELSSEKALAALTEGWSWLDGKNYEY